MALGTKEIKISMHCFEHKITKKTQKEKKGGKKKNI
jgi:hypothetical protein